MNPSTIILATDHAGFALKEVVKAFLTAKGYKTLDVGAHRLVEEDDYPTYIAAAAIKVAEDATGKTLAVIFGGSGQGEAMVANRFPGVRAAVWYGGDQDVLRKSREHDNANILSIGARYVVADAACDAVEVWLETPFSGDERHERRIVQIDSIE